MPAVLLPPTVLNLCGEQDFQPTKKNNETLSLQRLRLRATHGPAAALSHNELEKIEGKNKKRTKQNKNRLFPRTRQFVEDRQEHGMRFQRRRRLKQRGESTKADPRIFEMQTSGSR